MAEQLITCIYIQGKQQFAASRWHALLVYALRGHARLNVDGDSVYELERGQSSLALAGAGKACTLLVEPSGAAAVLRIDMRMLRKRLNDRHVSFSCEPSQRFLASYTELRRRVETLLLADAEIGDFADFHRSVAELTLLNCLLDGFGGVVAAEPSRSDAYKAYVDAHFDEPLTLAQMARHFGLSTEHFAKVFKAEVGETFHSYLTETRLEVATEQLCTTSDTVTRVALECGFPNVASFNQAFKARYDETPKRYQSRNTRSSAAKPKLPASEVALLTEQSATPEHENWEVAINARARREVLHASWRELIGLGTVAALSDSRVREQALWLKDHLHFERWRIDCDLARHAEDQSFYDLESCFDFLVGNGFVPHVTVEYDRDYDPGAYANSFSETMRRLANRYSVQTVRTWHFELVAREVARDDWKKYLELFMGLRQTLEAYGVEAAPVGPGLHCDHRCDNLRAFLQAAASLHTPLDAVSISCWPAAPAREGGEDLVVRTADRFYLRNQVLLAREVLEQEGFDPQSLVVGGWRDSLETSNIMNDSCYEAASIMQSVLSTFGLVQSLCYNDSLDLSVDASPSPLFLSGKPGIITRDGIPKPSYYAFDFLSHIDKGLVYADERCVASINDMGNIQIVCHNCEQLNAAYLTTPENQLSYQHITSYYDEPSARMLRVVLSGMRPGSYLLKTRFVNESGGSVGDEAQRMQMWNIDEPSRSEIEHLKSATQPQLKLERFVVTNGTLVLERELQSNEIVYMHLIYLY